MKGFFFGSGIGVAALFVFVFASQPSFAGDSQTPGDAPTDLSAAAAYCVANGGGVENRAPYFNTKDDPHKRLRLSRGALFCLVTRESDGCRVHTLVATL